MLELKYGINPHQEAHLAGAAPQIEEVRGAKVSFNALQDVLLGAAVAAVPEPTVVYVKHKLPLRVASASTIELALGRLVHLVQRADDLEFGAIVSNQTMTPACGRALRALRFHTIGAPGWSEPLLDLLYSAELQKKNREISVMRYAAGLSIVRGSLLLNNDCSAHYADPARAMSPGGYDAERARTNSAWSAPVKLELALRVLAHARTIAVVILHDGEVPLVRCGHYDGIAALREALAEAERLKVPLSSATIVCDGCFGVRSPIKMLSAAGVRQFVFSGGKANDEELLLEAAKQELGALCTKTRYFYY